MCSIGVIGDYDSICGFSALGLDIFPAENIEDAGRELKSLVSRGYGIIYITEIYMQQLALECEHYREAQTPSIVPIPSCTGVIGVGKALLKKCVEQAVGSDIIFKDN
ncbi:MAG: V-type ATP synthase subunit F [Oscillospiraceae bacterium]|nr:V-type ATP synthase subunit F [Oscillospiraceae bacterium]